MNTKTHSDAKGKTSLPSGKGLGEGRGARSIAAIVIAASLAQSSASRAQPATPTPSAPQSQPATPDPQEQFYRWQSQAMQALAAKDYPKAEGFLREQLALQPDSYVVLYNLACVRALQHDAPGGLVFLKQAISKGFVSRHEMEADDMLAPVRALPEYQEMIERWDAVLEAHKDAAFTLAQSQFPDTTQSKSDASLRLTFLNAFNEHSFEAAHAEMTKLAAWTNGHLFPGILDPESMRDDSWVVVVLPSQKDFQRWAVAMFGPEILQGFSTVGGSYNHDARRLIAQDLGPTLRHEFLHVLHWRSMTRLNQRHPIWIQEGVCSLVEDYDVVNNEVSPSTSWRTNTVQRMRSAGVLVPIRQLATKTNDHFHGQRRMGLYAQSRAVFLYLWQKGKLKDWYARYTAEFSEDPTGVLSLERTVGMKAEDFDKEFRDWADALELVPEEMRAGMPTLGVQVDTGTGEGPVVLTFQRRPTTPTRVKTPNDPAPKASPQRKPERLEPGDIITAINGQPVRDLPELLRRMGKLSPGQTVPVGVRRVKVHKTVDVTLGSYKASP
jgi:PDZ domain